MEENEKVLVDSEKKKEGKKKMTVADVYLDNMSLMVDAILASDASWTKSWNLHPEFLNYVSKRPYFGGMNLFMLSIMRMFSPKIGSESKSGYYVTYNESLNLGWTFKPEVDEMARKHREALAILKKNEVKGEAMNKAIADFLSTFTSATILFIGDSPVRKLDENGNPVFENGKPVYEVRLDKNGNVKLDAKGKPVLQTRMVMKFYTAYPIECFDRTGKELPNRGRLDGKPALEQSEAEAKADAILDSYIKAEGIHYSRSGNECYYVPVTSQLCLIGAESIGDSIVLAPDFKTKAGEIAVKAHECGHSTGAKNRLNRRDDDDDGEAKAVYGPTPSYSREELVAESCSLFFTSKMGVSNDETVRESFAYLKRYAEAIKNGQARNSLISGLNLGLKACDFIIAVGTGDEASADRVRNRFGAASRGDVEGAVAR